MLTSPFHIKAQLHKYNLEGVEQRIALCYRCSHKVEKVEDSWL